jgi:hypothetical protein
VPTRGFSKSLLDAIRDFSKLRDLNLLEGAKKHCLNIHSKKQADTILAFFELLHYLKSVKKSSGDVHSVLSAILQRTNYVEYVSKQYSKNPEKANMKVAVIKSFLNFSKSYSSSLEKFIEIADLSYDGKSLSNHDADHVTVTTIHQGIIIFLFYEY